MLLVPKDPGPSAPVPGRVRRHTQGVERSRNLDACAERGHTVFEALSDPTRLEILHSLQNGPTCVCELEASLGVGQSLLSYHLRVLREAGVVGTTRRGRRIDYRIRPTALGRARRALAAAFEGEEMA